MHDLELELGHVVDAVVSKVRVSVVPTPTQVGSLLRSRQLSGL